MSQNVDVVNINEGDISKIDTEYLKNPILSLILDKLTNATFGGSLIYHFFFLSLSDCLLKKLKNLKKKKNKC